MRPTHVLPLLAALACDPGKPTAQPQPQPQPQQLQPQLQPQPLDLSRLLLVDWPATDLSTLEQMLQARRAVILAVLGDSATLLPECHGPANAAGDEAVYTYAGMTPQRDHVTGPGHTLDTVHVGTWTGTRLPRTRAQLRGACDGASHVAHELHAGAFAQTTTTGSTNAAEVSAGGAVVGGSASSQTTRTTKGGDLAACPAAAPATPPSNCRAIFRVSLTPLAP